VLTPIAGDPGGQPSTDVATNWDRRFSAVRDERTRPVSAAMDTANREPLQCPSRQQMKRAGLPTPIRAAVLRAGRRATEFDRLIVARAQRFVRNWETKDADEEVKHAWAKIAKAAQWRNVEPDAESFFRGMAARSLVDLFEAMPDSVDDQPFAHYFGRRNTGPKVEREHYDDAALKLKKLVSFLRKFSIDQRTLLADLAASPGTSQISRRLKKSFPTGFVDELETLADAFRAADPFAKYFAKQEVRRAHRVFIARVFALADYLQVPEWESLARIATVNCERGRVTAQDLKNMARRPPTRTRSEKTSAKRGR
jgi:hypothetical protein